MCEQALAATDSVEAAIDFLLHLDGHLAQSLASSEGAAATQSASPPDETQLTQLTQRILDASSANPSLLQLLEVPHC